MTNFSVYWLGSYRDGQWPLKYKGATIVHYDQRWTYYRVPEGNHLEFIDWVSIMWADENNPMEVGENSQEYLDRLGVYIIGPDQKELN